MEPDFPTTTRLHPFTLMATPFHIKGVVIPKGYFTLKYKLLKNIYLK